MPPAKKSVKRPKAKNAPKPKTKSSKPKAARKTPGRRKRKSRAVKPTTKKKPTYKRRGETLDSTSSDPPVRGHPEMDYNERAKYTEAGTYAAEAAPISTQDNFVTKSWKKIATRVVTGDIS